MGGIYQRGNVWWIYFSEHGRQRHESSRSKVKRVAELLLKRREGKIATGGASGIMIDKVRWDDLYKDFLDEQSRNKRKSEWRAKISADHLKDFFEGYKVMDITTSKINDYIKRRFDEDKASPATINRELSALRKMFTLGKNHTPPKVGDVPKITMLEEHNIRKGFFEHQEFLNLRAKLPKHLYGPVTIGYYYGLRRAEICGLTWDNIDRKAGIIRLEAEDTKTDEPRTIYLNNECRTIIQAQWEARKSLKKILPYVFPNESGKGSIVDFRKSWATACEAIGLKGKLFHDLRRTAVRNMIRAGVPQVVAMAISGHRTTSVFNRYNIVNDDDLKKASMAITAHLDAQPRDSQKDKIKRVDFTKGRKRAKKTA